MASAKKLIEGVDDPESFDVSGHLESPVASFALKNGFIRDDRTDSEERWVKKLSNGTEAWLRTQAYSPWDYEKPLDMRDPRHSGGREWEFVIFTPPGKYQQIIRANEVIMSYTLGAFLQRLATWNTQAGPKPSLKRPVREARRPAPVPVPEPDDVDPKAELDRLVASKVPDFPFYWKLATYVKDNQLYVSGRVTRHSSHYVHQYSTTFELEVADIPPEHEAEIERLANECEDAIKEECRDINNKIYKALEREWDYLNSDEAVDEMMAANDYTFDEDGDHGGNIPFVQLNDQAKERARDWYRTGGLDYEWWDSIEDEWKQELEELGFNEPDIAFSGFSSQGDGASFTAKSFDFMKFVGYIFSTKTTERGHPYTDELFRNKP